jgi:hypothetical protein
VNTVLRTIIRQDAPRLSTFAPHLDEGMDFLVAKLMCRNPSGRLPSARALMRALDPWLKERVRTERRLASALEVARQTSSIRPTAQSDAAAA